MSSSKDIEVLFDADLVALADTAELVAICASVVDADFESRLVAPPRHNVDFGTGRLVFTIGGLDDTIGFRVYDTFPGSRNTRLSRSGTGRRGRYKVW